MKKINIKILNIVFYSSFLISVIQNYRSCSQYTEHLWEEKRWWGSWVNQHDPMEQQTDGEKASLSRKNVKTFCASAETHSSALFYFMYFSVWNFFFFRYSHIKRMSLFRRLLTTDITPSGLHSLASFALLNLMAGAANATPVQATWIDL